jgi:glycine/D-amino acid oxidase-like deaminating enzyme
LRLRTAKSIIFVAMNFDYDVAIIGGAFSDAATALMLKRTKPDARVLIIEKTAEFDRKVGESTTEVSRGRDAQFRRHASRGVNSSFP